MWRRIGVAILFGGVGIVFMPHLKTVLEAAMSFISTTSPIITVIKDNVYLIMIGLWVLIIFLILFYHRGSSSESESQ